MACNFVEPVGGRPALWHGGDPEGAIHNVRVPLQLKGKQEGWVELSGEGAASLTKARGRQMASPSVNWGGGSSAKLLVLAKNVQPFANASSPAVPQIRKAKCPAARYAPVPTGVLV